MVFNATFNNMSDISCQSVLLVEENREKTTDLSQVTDKLYHTLLYTSPWSRFELTTSVAIGTDCIGSCKSNYHTITATSLFMINRYQHFYRDIYILFQKCLYQVRVITVFTVFRLLTDFVFIYLWVLTFPL